MLTAKQLEEIRARAEKATKGPWCFAVLGDCAQLSPVERPKRVIGDLSIHDGRGNQYKNHISGEEGFSNSTFIAHAREDVPALLAEVERLKERNEKLERVKEAAKECLDSVGMAHYPHNVHIDYNKYESLRDALSTIDEQESTDAPKDR